MQKYDHKKIESKWQKTWEKKQPNKVKMGSKGKKFYALVEFPYPSGDGLHTGHVRGYTAMDIISRKRRADGYNVLYPMGWDAFGLPTENYAIKTGNPPQKVTKKNTDTFRKQLKSLGFSFDWSREINTTDPEYYKWTQWIFLQLFKKGLAYKAKMPINWCLSCKIGLANEEVIDGRCERCGGETEKRNKEQWMLAITKYADRLDGDLEQLDYLEKIKIQQKNWIGKSSGAVISFKLKTVSTRDLVLPVFTTRADTLFGVTYVVVAPEHEIISKISSEIKNLPEVKKYILSTLKKPEIERTDETKEKTGIKLEGIFAINPATGEEVPVYVADYVLNHYGTGAVMAVPAHDERDYLFAKKYNLPIIEVVKGGDIKTSAYTEDGELINSGQFNRLKGELAKDAIIRFVNAERKITFKLRDWVFSRQRYWGEPIPIIKCEKCGYVAVSEKDLPVKLPKVKDYKPTDTGESPLSLIKSWVNTKCPKCNGRAERETDTMPNWAGSSWYFLRYTDPKNKKSLADKKALKYFTPVDWYNGGMEHTTLHLLYSRFWHKFLFDIKVVPTNEPYKKRTSHGMILAPDGQKMSKSKGNVINPDSVVKNVGSDSLRVYEMFMGPFDQAISWSEDGVAGSRRFLERVWRLMLKTGIEDKKILKEKISKEQKNAFEVLLNQTIKKVTDDIESMKFNTAISQLMILTNEAEKMPFLSKDQLAIIIKLLSVFAPHITEEIWSMLKLKGSVHSLKWPKHNPKKLIKETVEIGVTINGKLRGTVVLPMNCSEDEAVSVAKNTPEIMKFIENQQIIRVVFKANKILNFVTS